MKNLRYLLLSATLAFAVSAFAQTKAINWMTIEEVAEAQKKEPRKVMIDTYTKWCGPCKKMMAETFTDGDVIDYLNTNFYAVKFNAEGGDDVTFKGEKYSNPNFDPNARGRNSQHEFAALLGVRAYPTIVYMDEEMNVLQGVPGYKTPKQLELVVTFFNEDHYKTVTTQEEFQAYSEKFEYTFGN